MANIDKDDQAWLDALAGKPESGSDSPAEREARLLRATIHAQQQSASAPPDEVERGLEQLLFRLRQEGLLDKAKKSPRHWPNGAWMAIAATVVIAVAVSALWPGMESGLSPTDEIGQMRGGKVQIIRASKPDNEAQQLRSELEKLGTRVETRQAGPVWVVKAQVPVQKMAEARLIAAQHGFGLPDDGMLRLEVRPLGDKDAP